MKECEMALEELIDKEDAAETEQRIVDDQKKMNESEDRKNAESVRKKAMERLGQTQKRKQTRVKGMGEKGRKDQAAATQ